jgi:hypothetical protein
MCVTNLEINTISTVTPPAPVGRSRRKVRKENIVESMERVAFNKLPPLRVKKAFVMKPFAVRAFPAEGKILSSWRTLRLKRSERFNSQNTLILKKAAK